MNIGTLIFVMAVLGFLAAGEMPGFAAESQPNTAAGQAASTVGNQAPGALVYVPPKLGAPRGRVGGGARGATTGAARLTVLAPDHPGRTLDAQPILYWYVSRATKDPVEFTLMSDDQIRPLIETRLGDSAQPGVHKVSLADYGFKLGLYSTYRWYVAVVHEPARRSKDIIAGGVIERVDVPDGLSEKLATAKAEDKPRILAEAGIWYDAIAALSASIDASPRDGILRAQRAALLEQVGLLDVAGYDLKGDSGN